MKLETHTHEYMKMMHIHKGSKAAMGNVWICRICDVYKENRLSDSLLRLDSAKKLQLHKLKL